MSRTAIVPTALLALAANPAWAQVDNPQGPYVGIGIGDFSSAVDRIDGLDSVDDVGLELDADEDAKKVFAGWRFNRFVAAQIDYIEFGESQGARNTLGVGLGSDTKGFAPSIVGTLPAGPVELFARAGVIFYDIDVTTNGLGAVPSPLIDSSGEDLVLGAGIGFDVLERFNVRAEYEQIDIDELDDADAIWLTAAWKF
jgi:hypothetical protein